MGQHEAYGSANSADDNLNRLTAIKDDDGGSPGDTRAAYTYLSPCSRLGVRCDRLRASGARLDKSPPRKRVHGMISSRVRASHTAAVDVRRPSRQPPRME